jgi:hypothetical protein
MKKQINHAEKHKYHCHKGKAKQRGIPFELTFDEWWDIWQESGKWEQRGRHKDQYCMSRVNDCGGYEFGNVFIQCHADNVKDAQKGRIKSLTERLKLSISHTGFKQSEETKKKIGIANKNKTSWNKGLTTYMHITN